MAIDIGEYLFKELNMQWYAKEVEDNLPLELDFNLEAKNSQRCKEMFKFDPQYKIPDVYSELSGKRVMTMEFVDGVSIADTQMIQEMGID